MFTVTFFFFFFNDIYLYWLILYPTNLSCLFYIKGKAKRKNEWGAQQKIIRYCRQTSDRIQWASATTLKREDGSTWRKGTVHTSSLKFSLIKIFHMFYFCQDGGVMLILYYQILPHITTNVFQLTHLNLNSRVGSSVFPEELQICWIFWVTCLSAKSLMKSLERTNAWQTAWGSERKWMRTEEWPF